MKRGVWIVETRDSGSAWYASELADDRADARARVRFESNGAPWGEEYRAVRYVPAAELTRKPRKRRKR